DTLSFGRIISQPQLGTIVINPNGSFTYTPMPNFYGTDRIVYKSTDGGLESANNGIITIIVNPVDDPPLARNDAATVAEDGGPTAIDVLVNDSLQLDEF